MSLFRASPQAGAAWVTGASTGIGKQLAIDLADDGYTVFISARSADKLQEIAASYSGKGNIIALPLDVTDPEANDSAVAQIVEKSGGLALAVFNAGTFYPVKANALDRQKFNKTMDINFKGVVNGLVPVVEAFKKQGRGQLAVVSSVAGYGGLPKSSAYGASKAALINMAESLKHDLASLNIRIQLINPGFVDTPLTEKNDFPMPFLISVEKASKRIVHGLRNGGFEITFPRRFTFLLKFLNLLPYPLYFALVGSGTGSGKPS